MAWTTIVLVSTGELATASVQNTHVLGNLNELRTGGVAIASQAALDFIHASSATQLARLAKGTGYQVPRLNSGATAYEFGQGLAPRHVTATAFETAARHTATVTGGGAVTFTIDGTELDTSATGTSSADLTTRMVRGNAGGVLTAYEGIAGIHITTSFFGTDFQCYAGLGAVTVAGAGITFTPDHAGFKILRAASGAASLYATQADGTTETASAALTTITADQSLDLCIVVTSAASISYFWRKDGSAWSSATTLTTNVPDLATSIIARGAVSNAGVATRTSLILTGAYYSR